MLSFSLEVMSDSAIPWTGAHWVPVSSTVSQSLPTLLSILSVMPSNHLILCHPLLSQPSIFPRIRVFSQWVSCSHQWPKHWSFSVSPSKEYSGLISSKIDWFDLLDAFELWCWQRLLRVPWKARRSKQQTARSRTICQEISKIFCFQLHPLLWHQVLSGIYRVHRKSPGNSVCAWIPSWG